MPEPARADGHVDLAGRAHQPVAVKDLRRRADQRIGVVQRVQRVRRRLVQRPRARLPLRPVAQLVRHHRPLALPRHARLVAAPAHVRPEVVENHRVGLVFADQLKVAREVIYLLFAVGSLAAGVVEPYIEDVAVARQQLGQLVAEVVVVLRRAVERVVPVPRREIKAEFDAAPAAGVRRQLHHVALKRAVLDRVLGVLARPQAEAVVVLRGEHQPLHARGFDGLHPLVAVQIRGIEHALWLRARAPLAVGEGVHAKVYERIEIQVEPVQLPLARHDARRRPQKVLHSQTVPLYGKLVKPPSL